MIISVIKSVSENIFILIVDITYSMSTMFITTNLPYQSYSKSVVSQILGHVYNNIEMVPQLLVSRVLKNCKKSKEKSKLIIDLHIKN